MFVPHQQTPREACSHLYSYTVRKATYGNMTFENSLFWVSEIRRLPNGEVSVNFSYSSFLANPPSKHAVEGYWVVARSALSLNNFTLPSDGRDVDQGFSCQSQVAYTHESTRVLVSDLLAVEDIATIEVDGHTAEPVVQNQRWLRSDINLQLDRRTHNGVLKWSVDLSVSSSLCMFRLAPTSIPQAMQLICHSDCVLLGFYDAESHVVLFCVDCDKWYHRRCLTSPGPLDTVIRAMPDDLPPHLNFIPEDPQSDDERMWAALLGLPIQRCWPNLVPYTPLSFEDLQVRAREYDTEEGVPAQVRKWIKATFDETMVWHTDDQRREAWNLLRRAMRLPPSERMVWKCPSGHFL